VIEFRVLGLIEVRAGRAPLALGPPQRRAVLAALAVDAGHPVTISSLVDRVWNESPPDAARTTLHAHLSRLRLALVDPGDPAEAPLLTRRGGGYSLDVDLDRVDLHRVRRLVDQARLAGHDVDRAALLREAVAMWQGTPLEGVPGDWALRTRLRIERQLVGATVSWADVEMRLGRAPLLIDSLIDLSDRQPLSEPLLAALLRALCEAGRGAEALAYYAAARKRWIDQLGAEPGAELRGLHEAILRGRYDHRRPAAPPVAPPANAPAAAPAPVRAEAGSVLTNFSPPAPRSRTANGAVSRSAGLAAELGAGLGAALGFDARLGLDPGGFPPVGPAELPLDVSAFVGRGRELATLDRLLGPDRPTTVAAITGTAGVGKTALAVHWAYRVASRFPDGQLYVDLRGYGAGHPADPADVLARLLRTLRLPSRAIPAETADRSALLRSVLAGRRLLLLLDNAADVAQVRPLLPGTRSCLVVVTSRDLLAGLVAREGASRIVLDLLAPADAVALLGTLLGDLPPGQQSALAALAERCARLPLALRVAAELAASRLGGSPAELVRELADDRRRLELLDAGGDGQTAVSDVFSWSFRRLPATAARAFRLLAQQPRREYDAACCATLVATDPDAGRVEAAPTRDDLVSARDTLDLLARAHLLIRLGPDRFTMHDLLRAYATSACPELGRLEHVPAPPRLVERNGHVPDATLGFPRSRPPADCRQHR
jgi:DNA-binding SARP family transcriptional activator